MSPAALHMPPVQFLVVRSLPPPEQYLPPFLGAGLLHSLRRKWRQSGPQEDHVVHCDHAPSTVGQTALQDFFWTGAPSQLGPPLRGAGLSHLRVRFLVPRPQSALQSAHSDQNDHWPLTENGTEEALKKTHAHHH